MILPQAPKHYLGAALIKEDQRGNSKDLGACFACWGPVLHTLSIDCREKLLSIYTSKSPQPQPVWLPNKQLNS